MKRIVYILLISVFYLSASAQDNEKPVVFENEVMYSNILKQEVKYTISLPEGYYSGKEKYPVVYMLHGLGDNSSSWLEYGEIDMYSWQAERNGDIIPMIYVMPEGYRSYYVNDFYKRFMYEDMFIKEFIPHIDNKYRTHAAKEARATMGYSMGGFGALMLAAKNRDVFSVTVPLSISLRTDKQYITEESPWWDEQWGRLFGGEGEKDEARLTDYYKQNSPLYFFSDFTGELKIFIDNGDDEQTLASSNEELHILLRDKNIPHEFRVRNGGHEFSYWKSALYNGLNFISDAFEGKPYRGDKKEDFKDQKATIHHATLYDMNYQVCLPENYDKGSRLYPVLYVDADLSLNEKEMVSGIVQKMVNDREIPQQIVVFFDSRNIKGDTKNYITAIEEKYRIRTNRRFRAYLGYKEGGKQALVNLPEDHFTCIASFDASLDTGDKLFELLKERDKKQFERTWIYIDAPDKGQNYRGNGQLHILLKEKDIYHEYRVREGNGSTDYLLQGLSESLKYIGKKFHK